MQFCDFWHIFLQFISCSESIIFQKTKSWNFENGGFNEFQDTKTLQKNWHMHEYEMLDYFSVGFSLNLQANVIYVNSSTLR